MELAIATATNLKTLHWTQGTITWDELVARLQKPADHRECGGYVLGELRPTLADHGEGPCRKLHRNAAAIVTRNTVTLDADRAQPSLPDKVVEALGERTAVHTTWSSQPDALRFRILVPLSRPVTPDEYRHIARVLMWKLGAEQFDKTCEQPERFMYWPSVTPEGKYQSW